MLDLEPYKAHLAKGKEHGVSDRTTLITTIGRFRELVEEVERLREALTEAPMRALGQTNGAFARWCMEQIQPAKEAPDAV